MNALLFDYDGLVVDTERTLADVIIEHVAAHGGSITYADFGHLFGSKDLSRAVASQAAQATGIGQQVLQQMLPVIASMIMGGLFKQSTSQLQAGQPAGGFGGGSGNPLQEIIEQMMRQGGGMGGMPGGAQPQQRQAPQQPADARDARVAIEQQPVGIQAEPAQLLGHRRRPYHHRAELRDAESAAAPADPLVAEEHGSPRLQRHGRGDTEHQRRREDQQDRGAERDQKHAGTVAALWRGRVRRERSTRPPRRQRGWLRAWWPSRTAADRASGRRNATSADSARAARHGTGHRQRRRRITG